MKSAHPPPNYFFRAGRSKMPKEADNQNSIKFVAIWLTRPTLLYSSLCSLVIRTRFGERGFSYCGPAAWNTSFRSPRHY